MSYTVTEFSNLIKETLKNKFNKNVTINGEISNMKRSGPHLYFTIKDNESSLSATIWNIDQMNIVDIQNGDKVSVIGKLGTYSKMSNYQLTCVSLQKMGLGMLFIEYNKLKEKYDKLGYFDVNRKKQLNKVDKIVVVTAVNGAALKDFLHVLENSNYKGIVDIKNTIVQGKECPNSVSDCIKELDKMNYDVIIVTRGGGSFEDLFGFSDSKVIEAIYNCKTPTISAIGHHVDNMLSDYVADIRAATPSVSAQIIADKYLEIVNIKTVSDRITRLISNEKSKISNYLYRLDNLNKILGNKAIVIDNIKNMVKSKTLNILSSMLSQNCHYLNRVKNMYKTLENYNPQTIMKNGYIMLLDSKNRHVKSYQQYIKLRQKYKNDMKLVFHDGVIDDIAL